MSQEEYRRRDEKAEKEEKDEKDQGEREWGKGEEWSRDALGSLIWGLIIIFAGLAFLAVSLGTLPWLTWSNVWSVIFIAAGLAFFLEVVIRVAIPTYRRAVRGRLILAFILLAIGVGGVIGWELTWPLILVGVGLAIILGILLRPGF